MSTQTFEDVIAWQKAKQLYIELYTDMRGSKEYVLRDKLLEATLQISNHIADGYDRGGRKEFRQSVLLARGAAAEVRSMLYVGLELGILPVKKVPKYLTLAKEITRLLTGLAGSLAPTSPPTNNRKRITDHTG